jgi:lipoprotein-releasing system ATP-binding protein
VLFADEPTGNLDAAAGQEIIRLLRDLNRDEGVTIIMVTHNLELVASSDRVLKMTSGKIVEDSKSPAWPAAPELWSPSHEHARLHQREAD